MSDTSASGGLTPLAEQPYASYEAVSAFMTLSEAIGTETDLDRLAIQAMRVLDLFLPGLTSTYYERVDGLWKARVVGTHVRPELADVVRRGLPLDTPAFQQATDTRAPVFIDGWDPESQVIGATDAIGAGALYPYFLNGEAHGMFTTGTTAARAWTPQDRAQFLAVSRSLGLAIERAHQVTLLEEQREEADRRARALEAFAQFAAELGVLADQYDLIRRAQEVALSLLPPGYAAYFEPQGGRWRVRSQVGDVRGQPLQAAIDAGFVQGETPTLDRPARTLEPLFIDEYDQTTDIDPLVVRQLRAAVVVPVVVGGQLAGLFNIPLFDTRSWSAVERAVVTTTVRSLELALERNAQARLLRDQRDALDRRTQELEAANEELDAFTYSASHDLRTPIRHIMGFTTLARTSLNNQQPERVLRHLEIVQQSAARMEGLIDGMLMLSRAGREDFRPRPVPLGPLLTQALTDAAQEWPERNVQLRGPAPVTLWGDATLLQQVMTNLISNAVKYSSAQASSEVDVEVQESGTEWVITVRDNGAGFNPKYAGKLFGIFQRLHAQHQFPGIGVGLATVRRIVLKHGGRVFAQSVEGHGATFGFTLPKPPTG